MKIKKKLRSKKNTHNFRTNKSEDHYQCDIPLTLSRKHYNDVGYYVNPYKTEFIGHNQQSSIQNVSGESIKSIKSFTYLGSETNFIEKGVEIRIDKACTALEKMDLIWKSNLSDNLMQKVFRAIVEGGVSVWYHCMDID